MVKLSALQFCSQPDVNQNIEKISSLLSGLLDDKTSQQATTETQLLPKVKQHIVVLPECCLFFGGKDSEQLALAKQTEQSQHLVKSLSALAKQYQITLVAGTIPLLSDDGTKFTNSSCVFSPDGTLLGRYNKIHLFDVNVNDSEKQYLESKVTEAGRSVEVVSLAENKAETATMTIGLSVCYDLRFASLFRALRTKGATVITVPSAFTRVTGKAHWQALLQARAIENQVYIVAAGQEGIHANGRETWGHSMIINPWGEIITCIETGEGFISAQYEQKEINRIRADIPVHEHNKFTVELTKYE